MPPKLRLHLTRALGAVLGVEMGEKVIPVWKSVPHDGR